MLERLTLLGFWTLSHVACGLLSGQEEPQHAGARAAQQAGRAHPVLGGVRLISCCIYTSLRREALPLKRFPDFRSHRRFRKQNIFEGHKGPISVQPSGQLSALASAAAFVMLVVLLEGLKMVAGPLSLVSKISWLTSLLTWGGWDTLRNSSIDVGYPMRPLFTFLTSQS